MEWDGRAQLVSPGVALTAQLFFSFLALIIRSTRILLCHVIHTKNFFDAVFALLDGFLAKTLIFSPEKDPLIY